MNSKMDIIEKLTEIFKEFPGIGERQAKRFVYFLMSRNPAYGENLAELIKDLKKETAQCKECYRFFILNSKKDNLCNNCSSPNTDASTLMILEKDSDLESIKKSGIYHGKYFILGGLVPIVEKTTKSRVRIEELKKKISLDNDLKEIILAFSISPQGNHTDQYVREQLQDITEKLNPSTTLRAGIKISSLGKGLSTGTELEYSDNDTLKNALKNRQ
ncbi:MAG: toprim domain-containing protein [Candidatus Paceibacterota bacterium]